jgi:2-polyprenyl-3-methyl-5-hydroxy-6-metoxy-1,4-benzoquinol methylase
MKANTGDWEKGIKPYFKQISRLSFKGRQWNRKNILEARDFLSPWDHNIKLPYDIFTAFCEDYYPAHKEIMNVINQQLGGDFKNKSIIDIGCLEGYFSAECALQGASVLGIDGKVINVKKCELVKSVLGVKNLKFAKDDAMRVTKSKYGSFDAVLALGLLYHLDNPFKFLKNMHDLCNGFMVLDTHIALIEQPETLEGSWRPDLSSLKEFKVGNKTYTGRLYREFESGTSQLSKDLSRTTSLKNDLSVWLTEDSLVTLLRDVGFEQVSKIVFPKIERGSKMWWTDTQWDARVLVLAIKKREPFKSKIFTDS